MENKRIEVRLTRQAEKDLDRIKHDREKAVQEIMRLERDPLLGHTLKGSLQGARAIEFTLRGGGAYRAVYVIDRDVNCIVFIVGSHENIYKRAQRRFDALARARDE